MTRRKRSAGCTASITLPFLARSTAYSLLVVLGCVFIGLALITVVGANWDTIPRGLRMAGLLALTVGAHGLALRLHLSGSASVQLEDALRSGGLAVVMVSETGKAALKDVIPHPAQD